MIRCGKAPLARAGARSAMARMVTASVARSTGAGANSSVRGRRRRLRTPRELLLPALALLAVSTMPLMNAQWTGVVGYTSFEEPAALPTAAGFRDPLGSDSDHELSNGAGRNPVQYTSCTTAMAELGFRSFYINAASNVAQSPMFTGDAHIGVVGDSTTASGGTGGGAAPDGSQYFMLEGVGGFVYVELDTTDVSSYSSTTIAGWVHVEATNWEPMDYLKVWADTDSGEVMLVSGRDLDTLGVTAESCDASTNAPSDCDLIRDDPTANPPVVGDCVPSAAGTTNGASCSYNAASCDYNDGCVQEASWKEYSASGGGASDITMKFGLHGNSVSEEVWFDWFRITGTSGFAPDEQRVFITGCRPLNRLSCTEDGDGLCGPCLPGYDDGGVGDKTLACAVDCSNLDFACTDDLHRADCSGTPNKCGACLSGSAAISHSTALDPNSPISVYVSRSTDEHVDVPCGEWYGQIAYTSFEETAVTGSAASTAYNFRLNFQAGSGISQFEGNDYRQLEVAGVPTCT